MQTHTHAANEQFNLCNQLGRKLTHNKKSVKEEAGRENIVYLQVSFKESFSEIYGLNVQFLITNRSVKCIICNISALNCPKTIRPIFYTFSRVLYFLERVVYYPKCVQQHREICECMQGNDMLHLVSC